MCRTRRNQQFVCPANKFSFWSRRQRDSGNLRLVRAENVTIHKHPTYSHAMKTCMKTRSDPTHRPAREIRGFQMNKNLVNRISSLDWGYVHQRSYIWSQSSWGVKFQAESVFVAQNLHESQAVSVRLIAWLISLHWKLAHVGWLPLCPRPLPCASTVCVDWVPIAHVRVSKHSRACCHFYAWTRAFPLRAHGLYCVYV